MKPTAESVNAQGCPASLAGIMDFVNVMEQAGTGADLPIRFSFLRNFTIEGIEPYLKYHCLMSGLGPQIVFGNYDMMRQEILDKKSHLYVTDPDIVVAAIYLETFLPDRGRTGGWDADAVMADLAGLYADLAANTVAIIAVNTFIPPFHSDLGIASSAELPSHYREVLRLNQLVREFVRANPSRFVLVDWERLVRLLGEDESMDYRFWYMSKAPFKKGFLDLYALELVKVARALKGKAKKCLVLDCDNTLWGGIIGEDGLQGVKLDMHTYPGSVFHEFQLQVLALHERGVLVALCSKNNEADVWEVLEKHPYALIKREHLAAWRINWQDKATNLKELATELNLGLDSFVFVDDNQTECGLVRNLIPEVTVLQVPTKLYNYPGLLAGDGWFDTLSLSAEDRRRSQMYREEAGRRHEQAKYETIEQYLASLSLSIAVHPARPDEVLRVAQLTQKTNQFNLTTRRYSEAQIANLVVDPAWAVISLSVRDKFGDSGLTGVLIARNDGGSGIIDTLLLSCRILGRNIEVAFVLKALELMEGTWRIENWQATYIQSAKNQQVADFWRLIGFAEISQEQGQTLYELAPGTQRREAIPYIAIETE